MKNKIPVNSFIALALTLLMLSALLSCGVEDPGLTRIDKRPLEKPVFMGESGDRQKQACD